MMVDCMVRTDNCEVMRVFFLTMLVDFMVMMAKCMVMRSAVWI